MNINQPAFRPNGGATVALNASSASSSVQVQTDYTSRHFRIYNSGNVVAFLAFGGAAVAAAVPIAGGAKGDTPLGPGEDKIFAAAEQYAAAVTPSGTTTLYITPGEGMQ